MVKMQLAATSPIARTLVGVKTGILTWKAKCEVGLR